MRNKIPFVLQIVGVVLFIYGIYKVIVPEAAIDLGVIKATAQDNTDAYTTIAIGLASLVLGYFMGKRNKIMALTTSNPFPFGSLAPEFSLLDAVSKTTRNLQQLKGEKATVIMFICNHCPFVIHINTMLVQLASAYNSEEVSFIAISSNDVENYPQDSPELMAEVAKKEKYPFPYLYDESQDIAKAYDAACTPDFYVFDSNLKSTYHGQLDDSRPKNGIPVTGKDLRQAIENTLVKKITDNQKPSMGCGIKWK